MNLEEFTLKDNSTVNLLKRPQSSPRDPLGSLIAIQRMRNDEKVLPTPSAQQFDKYSETRRRVEESLENQRKMIGELEMQGVTFQPEINDNSSKLAKTSEETDVLARTKAWAHFKNERRKQAIQAKLEKEEKEVAVAIAPMRIREASVEGLSKVKPYIDGFMSTEVTKSALLYNKGNYQENVPSRLEKKLKNWESRKRADGKGEDAKKEKVKVNFEEFKMALHHKINKN